MEQNLITTKNKFTYNHIALIIHILPLFFFKNWDKKFVGFIDALGTVQYMWRSHGPKFTIFYLKKSSIKRYKQINYRLNVFIQPHVSYFCHISKLIIEKTMKCKKETAKYVFLSNCRPFYKIPFYYLTAEYLISESILNSVNVLSSHILNNVRFLKPLEIVFLMAETIVT